MHSELRHNKNLGSATAAVVFAIIALVHLCRLFTHFSVAIAGHEIPMLVSVVSFILLSVLSIWLWTCIHEKF
jgi:hypothetical protein